MSSNRTISADQTSVDTSRELHACAPFGVVLHLTCRRHACSPEDDEVNGDPGHNSAGPMLSAGGHSGRAWLRYARELLFAEKVFRGYSAARDRGASRLSPRLRCTTNFGRMRRSSKRCTSGSSPILWEAILTGAMVARSIGHLLAGPTPSSTPLPIPRCAASCCSTRHPCSPLFCCSSELFRSATTAFSLPVSCSLLFYSALLLILLASRDLPPPFDHGPALHAAVRSCVADDRTERSVGSSSNR